MIACSKICDYEGLTLSNLINCPFSFAMADWKKDLQLCGAGRKSRKRRTLVVGRKPNGKCQKKSRSQGNETQNKFKNKPMKTKIQKLFTVLTLLALSTIHSQLSTVFAQGATAFTYQGQLHDGGTNANGTYTLIFALYDSASGGAQIGAAITNNPTLANGIFTVNLDFGAGAFNGGARWLDITIANGGTTQTLSPRVQLLPTPYATSAGNLANGIWDVGVTPTNQIPPNVFYIVYNNGSLGMSIDPNGTVLIGKPLQFGPGGSKISAVSGGLSVNGNLTANSFITASDRNLKENFAPINSLDVLKRVSNLAISSWNFKTDGQTRHIGPMAQDFYAAFSVGADDRHIATVDEDGVALAAIQGLNEKLKEKDGQIEALNKRLADLEQLVKTPAQK
jgi:hypothetical protein